MLVLSRREGDSVKIGNDIKITVIAMRNGQVRLGFDAPDEVTILRSELEAASNDSGTPRRTARSTTLC